MVSRARLLAVVAVLAWFPAAASAQRSTTGTIVGKIVDSSGSVLPGVTISLKSPEALGDFTAVDRRQRCLPRHQSAARHVRHPRRADRLSIRGSQSAGPPERGNRG